MRRRREGGGGYSNIWNQSVDKREGRMEGGLKDGWLGGKMKRRIKKLDELKIKPELESAHTHAHTGRPRRKRNAENKTSKARSGRLVGGINP